MSPQNSLLKVQEEFATCGHADQSDFEDSSFSTAKLHFMEKRFIVDRNIVDTIKDATFITIESALEAARRIKLSHNKMKLKVKVTSNLYEESLLLDVPNLVLEPKEKGGEVTIQGEGKPCITVDVGDGNHVIVNNIRMLLKGVVRTRSIKSNLESTLGSQGQKTPGKRLHLPSHLIKRQSLFIHHPQGAVPSTSHGLQTSHNVSLNKLATHQSNTQESLQSTANK